MLDETAYLAQLDAWRAELVTAHAPCGGQGYVQDPEEIDLETLFPRASTCACLQALQRRAVRYKAGIPPRYVLDDAVDAARLAAGTESVVDAAASVVPRLCVARLVPGEARAHLGAFVVRRALDARRSAYWLSWGLALRVADRLFSRGEGVRAWFDAVVAVDLLVVDGPDTAPDARAASAGGAAWAGAMELGYAMERRMHGLGCTVILSSCEPAALGRWPQLAGVAESAERVGAARRRVGDEPAAEPVRPELEAVRTDIERVARGGGRRRRA